MTGGAGIVTILFTDLVDSTRLLGRLGEEGAEGVRREHFTLLRDAVAARGGEEVKSVGDGLMVVFPSVVEAVSCAIAMQQSVQRHNQQNPEHALGVRIGLNVGEPTRQDDDYFGTPVVVAKRLCDSADGGQIIASDLVRALAIGRAGLDFRTLGTRDLKGLDEPVAAFEVAWEPLSSSLIPLPSELVRGARDPFVGRADELDRLRTSWKRILDGGLELVLVAGEPGIGKTRLSSELASGAHDDGAIVLLGRCDELSSVPYRPFLEALTHYVAALDDDGLRTRLGARVGRLASLVPDLMERLPDIRTPEPTDPETDRYRLFEAVTDTLSEASRDARLLLILDDLHWADAPSLHLLRHILRSSDGNRMLIVGTYRETDLGRTHPLADVLADLRRQEGVERIHLRGFDMLTIADWLGAAGGHEIGRRGRRLAEALYETTEGNPFFVQQIVAHLVESGSMFFRDGVWTFDEDVSKLAIPEGVKEVVGRRLARLSDAANRALESAAVLGREFELETVQAMSSVPPLTALGLVGEALSLGIITEVENARRPTYSFTHALMRQTLYDEIHLARKQRLHLEAADAIEQVHSRDLDPFVGELAAHYRLAGAAADPGKAIDYSIRAGEASRRVAAYEEAATHWKAALELVEETGNRERRASILERLGDLMYVSGLDQPSGLDYLERSLADYQALGMEDRIAQLHSKLGRSLLPPGRAKTIDVRRAIEHFQAAETVLSKRGDSVQLGYVLCGMTVASRAVMKIEEGIVAAERALAIADRLGNEALRAQALPEYSLCLSFAGRLREAIAVAEEAVRLADALGQPFVIWHSCLASAYCATLLLDPVGEEQWYRHALDQDRVTRSPLLRTALLTNLIWPMVETGRMSEIHETIRDLGVDFGARGAAVALAVRAGDWERAARMHEDMREESERTGADISISTVHAWYGEMYDAQGDLDRAAASYSAAVEFLQGSGADGFQAWCAAKLGLALARLGRLAEARAQLDYLVSVFTDPDDRRGMAGVYSLTDAVILATEDRVGEAADSFEKAIAIFKDYTLPWYEAEALHDWGRMLGDRSKLEAAIEIYERIDAPEFWAERVRADLA